MKLIEAIIQPARLEAVKEALSEAGVVRLTVSDVEGLGGETSRKEVFRGQEYTVDTVRKVKLEIAVNEAFVEPTVECIVRAGRIGEEGGDGKVFILPLEDVVRIRTGERGPEAI
ncbi:MAG TPA: P-II family nitrogen regulator [Candidatus Hypogeohydataceae bacterium YC38]|nr:P-II family nitrogen regulator [Candidatus Brocadiales bacterium]